MSNSVRPHRLQPTRLPRPWDSPDKNTGVDCHFLLQCMKVKSEREVAQLCLTLSDPMEDPVVHGFFFKKKTFKSHFLPITHSFIVISLLYELKVFPKVLSFLFPKESFIL